MSFQDRLMAQDTMQLLAVGASLSLVTSSSITGFSYNFPLMLFGIVAHEISSIAPFRHFLSLLAFSGLFDFFNLIFHFAPASGFVLLFEILILIIKLPIFFSGLSKLRERGGDIQPPWAQGLGGWSVPSLNTASLGAGGSHATGGGGSGIPGGFGYGPVRSTLPTGNGAQTGGISPGGGAQRAAEQDGHFPSTGGFRLGGDEDDTPPLPPRGGYQTIA